MNIKTVTGLIVQGRSDSKRRVKNPTDEGGSGGRSHGLAQHGYGVASALAVLGVLLTPGTVGALQPCESNCARLAVGDGSGRPGRAVPISISFEQGPDDGQPGRGNDEIAAIAFTLGIPGTLADPAPLVLPCVNMGDGSPNRLAPDAVEVGAAIADGFRVVIENAECVNRERCLCPGDGQQRDDFVNVVVYGPKDLPDQGPVDIPVLPASALLLTLNLRVASGAAPQVVALRLFTETDNGSPAKPQFAAFTSIGDQSGVDETADRPADRSKIAFRDGTLTINEALCVGDCDSSGSVSINKLVVGVNIALGMTPLDACPSFDDNSSGSVEVDELISGVNNALNGCP
jgi:hypothetical protein